MKNIVDSRLRRCTVKGPQRGSWAPTVRGCLSLPQEKTLAEKASSLWTQGGLRACGNSRGGKNSLFSPDRT